MSVKKYGISGLKREFSYIVGKLNSIIRSQDTYIDELLSKREKVAVKIQHRKFNLEINLWQISHAGGGLFNLLEETRVFLFSSFDHKIQRITSIGYIHYLFNNEEALKFVFNSLSDEISKRIYYDFVSLNILQAFIGENYRFDSEALRILIENFNYIGLKNFIVYSIYINFLRKINVQANKIDDRFVRFRYKNFDVIVKDIYSVWPAFLANQYYHNKVKVEPGDVVFDIGAYDGLDSIRFTYSKPEKIYSFEFDDQVMDILNLHIKYNCPGNVIIVDKPVSNRKKIVKVVKRPYGNTYISDTLELNRSINKEAKHIETITIDEFVKDNNIKKVDFIKMDIEGEEYNALKGAQNTLKSFKPKLAIAVYHYPEHPFLIIKYLKKLGYREFYLSHRHPGIADLILFSK